MSAQPSEPYRTKVVERIRLLDPDARKQALAAAGWSVFQLAADDVYVDLLTDSGTAAMSNDQWAALMRGDEAYANSRSYRAFEDAVRRFTGYEHVVPVHQGRAAEHLAMHLLVAPDQIVAGNAHFDTTRAHVEHRGATAVDCAPDGLWQFEDNAPFRGDADLAQLEALLAHDGHDVAMVVLTVLNNLACSSPVSMENIRAVHALSVHHGVPLFFDAARCAENAWFIKQREPGFAEESVASIVREMLSYGAGCWMSAKKDGLVNIGGFLATPDAALADRARELLVLFEGFPSYGGLARRDLEAIAVGLDEAVDEGHLRHRVGQVAYLAHRLREAGIVVGTPPGGSGVFLDVDALYPHLVADDLPTVALTCELYLHGGVRAGAAPFVLTRVDPDTGALVPRTFQAARLAIPRRVYNQAHLDHVVRTLLEVQHHAPATAGYRVVHAPEVLPHFFARFAPREATQRLRIGA